MHDMSALHGMSLEFVKRINIRVSSEGPAQHGMGAVKLWLAPTFVRFLG